MKHKKILSRILLFVLAVTLFAGTRTAYANSSSLEALDTVAGFGTVIKTENLAPNSRVTFGVTNPEGETVKLTALADTKGIARASVPEDKTRLAGIYNVNLLGRASETTFTVFPGEMDLEKSSLYATKTTVAANAIDRTAITVRVVDTFLNPLPFHEVKLFSSRSQDKILERESETNEQGLAIFEVSSSEPGISVLTASDQTNESVLEKRLKVFFIKTKAVFKEIGGDPETVLLAQASADVAKLKIENLPASTEVNETLSFTVSALDSDDEVVSTYNGTVTFSGTDTNAKLPNSYTFKSSDQGSRTFNLALSFRTAGMQKIIVKEQGNALIKGEKTIEVVRADSGGTGPVKITKPATGTYSVNTLEIAGETEPNAKVKIFDNGQQIGEVESKSSGRFSYTSSILEEGEHLFHAESGGVESTPVKVTIDTTPAQVEQIDISKTHLAPGDSTEISLRSDPDLNSVQATVGDVITDLEADPQNPGLYQGRLTAPSREGEYTVNVIITDSIGNVSSAVEVGKLIVDASVAAGGSGVASNIPTQVTGLKAAPGRGRVTLSWSPAEASSGMAFYRVYYGTDPAELKSVANTKDTKTTWYIPNLINGKKYYFQVFGVDTEGNEGDKPSALVSATPSETARESPVLCEPEPCPEAGLADELPEDGPGVLIMIVGAVIGGGVVRRFRKQNQ